MLENFRASKKAPWSRPNSFEAKLGATLHTSWELNQIVSLEPIVDAIDVADMAAGMVVEAFVEIVSDTLDYE